MSTKRNAIHFISIIICSLSLLTACTAKNQTPPASAVPTAEAAVTVSAVIPALSEADDPQKALDAYVGTYANADYDTVTIEKAESGYAMDISLYRLTSLDDGTVSAAAEGVQFRTLDAGGNQMTLLFYPDGETYSLRVEESTWPLLEQGTVIDGFQISSSRQSSVQSESLDSQASASGRKGLLPPYGEGQFGVRAVILCESLTVREKPSTSAKAVQTLHYGDFLLATKLENGWAECYQSDDKDGKPIGWVNLDYIALDPAWYKTYHTTPVYAWDDLSAPKVALLDKDIMLPVLKDEGSWVIVSLRGATGWIHID